MIGGEYRVIIYYNGVTTRDPHEYQILTNMVKIYVKGVASLKNGCGSYAFAITVDDVLYKVDSEWYADTTSNRMELQAILNGILSAPSSVEPVTVITENNYAGAYVRNMGGAKANLDILHDIQVASHKRGVMVARPKGVIDGHFISLCSDSAKKMYHIVNTTHSDLAAYLRAKGNI